MSPPRDDYGNVVPHDDPEILDDDLVIRRIHPAQWVKLPDGGYRPSSGAFSTTSDDRQMSVDIEKKILADGKTIVEVIPRDCGAASISVRFLRRSEGYLVGSDPLEENPYHGGVWGQIAENRRKRIQKQATVVVDRPAHLPPPK